MAQEQQDAYFESLSFMQNEEYEKAILLAERFLQTQANDADFNLLLAELYINVGLIEKAKTVYIAVEDKYPLESFYGQAVCAAANMNLKETLIFLDQYFNTSHHAFRSEIISNEAFAGVSDEAEWKAFWNRIHFSKKEQSLDEIIYNINADNFFEAIELSQNLLKERESHLAYYYLAMANSKLGYNNLALKNIRKALKIKVNEEKYLCLYARVLQDMEQYENATQAWTNCIDENNLKPNYYLQRAISANNSENFKLAHQDLTLYRKYFVNNDSAQYMFAVVSMNIERYWDAIQAYNILIERTTSKKEYFNDRGFCFYTLEEWRPAMHDFQMSLDINPVQGEVWYMAGICAYWMNDKEKACFLLKKAVHYNYPEAQIALQKYCR